MFSWLMSLIPECRGTKIYLACFDLSPRPWGTDVEGQALCEDGRGLADHISSNRSWSQFDMGFTDPKRKHDIYREACPEGYELEWVDDPERHDGWRKALEINGNISTEGE